MEYQFSKEKKWNSSHLLLILLVKLKSKNRLCDSCSFMRELSLFCSSLGAEEADDHLPEALPNRPIEMRGVQCFVRLWVTKHASHCHLLDSESTEEMEQFVLYTDRNWGWALQESIKQISLRLPLNKPHLGRFLFQSLRWPDPSSCFVRVGWPRPGGTGHWLWPSLLLQFAVPNVVQADLNQSVLPRSCRWDSEAVWSLLAAFPLEADVGRWGSSQTSVLLFL